MQARAKNKVAVQKGSGPVKKIKNVVHMLIRKWPIFSKIRRASDCKSLGDSFDGTRLNNCQLRELPARLFRG
jgi:hypothetical protein